MRNVMSCVLLSAIIASSYVPVVAEESKPTIYIAGESTAQTYNKTMYPKIGWGQVLADNFTNSVVVENRAVGGRSSRKFDDDGNLDKLLSEIKTGDYLFIQFGMTDSKKEYEDRYLSIDDYKSLLRERYIGETKKRGAIPVLMTPSAQLSWDNEKSIFNYSYTEYSDATRELAAESGCRFIDINKLMTDKFNTMNKEDVFSCYMICEPLEYTKKLAGTSDHTNFKEKGARLVAKLIAEAIPKNVPELEKYLKHTESFVDIDDHWAKDNIMLAQEKGFVSGNGDGKFVPDSNVTRAEFLKMAMNAADIPGHGYRAGECLEVKENDWYCNYLQSALDKDLIPAEMLVGGAQKTVRILSEATDSEDAVIVDIMSYSGGFRGNNPITREEMAAIAINCLSYAVKRLGTELNDINDLTEFTYEGTLKAYVPFVQKAYKFGIVNGDEDDSFYPTDNLTRAQAVTVINRIAEKLK